MREKLGTSHCKLPRYETKLAYRRKNSREGSKLHSSKSAGSSLLPMRDIRSPCCGALPRPSEPRCEWCLQQIMAPEQLCCRNLVAITESGKHVEHPGELH